MDWPTQTLKSAPFYCLSFPKSNNPCLLHFDACMLIHCTRSTRTLYAAPFLHLHATGPINQYIFIHNTKHSHQLTINYQNLYHQKLMKKPQNLSHNLSYIITWHHLIKKQWKKWGRKMHGGSSLHKNTWLLKNSPTKLPSTSTKPPKKLQTTSMSGLQPTTDTHTTTYQFLLQKNFKQRASLRCFFRTSSSTCSHPFHSWPTNLTSHTC